MTELQFPSVRLVNATLAQVSLNFRLISASTHELQRQRGCHLEPGTWNLEPAEIRAAPDYRHANDVDASYVQKRTECVGCELNRC